ncbi:hypothetical protein [Sessilibacter corallicola]|uniref:Uncharacterized protein n=1 Tax=Sessilibacter corallicola TaxID=2904075 RepID=A0ABQ0AEU5_9GAMM|nr:hypothetical protein [Sessilibacter corallicola]MCE2027225.1 hypothetical protein [Sessilibacter corallicola]
MITIEKDSKAEEIFIHATPEDLREFAKKLWAISEKADTKGKHKEQLTTKRDADVFLSTELQSEPQKHSIIKKLTISSRIK